MFGAGDGDQGECHVDVEQGQAVGHGLHAHGGQVDAVQAAGPAVQDGVLGQGPSHGVVQHAGVAIDEPPPASAGTSAAGPHSARPPGARRS
jgi:hypothetical protein